MKLPKLRKKLEKLDSIEYINAGGCGISVLAIYKYLKKKGLVTKNTTFVYIYEGGMDEDTYKQNLRNCKDGNALIAPAHALLKNKDDYIDSKRISKNIHDWKYSDHHHEVTLDELIKSINKKGWCWLFDRKEQVSKIENIMKIKLSEVK